MIFYQISAVCIGVCAYMHTTFLVGEIAAKLYRGIIFLPTENSQSVFFCLLLMETCICFNHNIV